jgi:hypothetical protein
MEDARMAAPKIDVGAGPSSTVGAPAVSTPEGVEAGTVLAYCEKTVDECAAAYIAKFKVATTPSVEDALARADRNLWKVRDALDRAGEDLWGIDSDGLKTLQGCLSSKREQREFVAWVYGRWYDVIQDTQGGDDALDAAEVDQAGHLADLRGDAVKVDALAKVLNSEVEQSPSRLRGLLLKADVLQKEEKQELQVVVQTLTEELKAPA